MVFAHHEISSLRVLGLIMTTTVFVYTLNRVNAPGKWSRYVFPFPVDYWVIKDDKVYIRSGNDVLRMDRTALYDYQGDPTVPSRQQPFDGIVQWGWLDDGTPGLDKEFDGIDFTGKGSPFVSFGYDQSNLNAFTAEYLIPANTYPGDLVPVPISAPSVSVRLRFAGPQAWKVQSVNLWVNDTNGRPS